MTAVATKPVDLREYLAECQQLALGEIRRLIATNDHTNGGLYELMLDYPMRAAKGLRPALCIATCRALGGGLEAVLPSASVLELYHNAFLIHDDIEDNSETRRDRPTLHREHGVPIAINVGDGMLALALTPLLHNTQVVGLGKSLQIIQAIARMARETAEGQAIELGWISHNTWDVSDGDYCSMVTKKTGWYSFVTPVTIGAIIAGASHKQRAALVEMAHSLAIAFQIRDDVLNLTEDLASYGKELNGDLWEGKRTLALLHALRSLPREERDLAVQILARPRGTAIGVLFERLERSGDLSTAGRARLEQELGLGRAKSAEDVGMLRRWIARSESVAHADAIGRVHAERARTALDRSALRPSVHRQIIERLIEFAVDRDY